MGLLDKLAQAREATGSTSGGSKSFTNKSGLWVNLDDGDNIVRLGGNVAVCERHYVVDLVNPDALKPKGEDRPVLSKNVTCLNWDIDNQKRIGEELHCCPICDLRMAANTRRREAKDAKNKEMEDKMKELSGKSYARSRYSWDAISRADPSVKTTDGTGNETDAPGWKILNVGTEATEAIEALAKKYPQIADPKEGCDISISRHKSSRITYGASFDLDGANIKISPLSDAEKAMEPVDLLRYVASHSSPRAVFESLKPGYQELITDVLGKSAEDYPSEAPVKKTIRKDGPETDSDEGSEAPVRRAATPAKVAPVRKRAASVADEFESVSSEEPAESKNDTFDGEEEAVEEKPAAPKRPEPPKKPSPPKKPVPPKPLPTEEEVAKEEVVEEEAAEEEVVEEEAVEEEAKESSKIKPTCYGFHDSSESECQKCKSAKACEADTE